MKKQKQQFKKNYYKDEKVYIQNAETQDKEFKIK